MNIENQNVEFKENWRDEYLKWICGFANAQGGTPRAVHCILEFQTMVMYADCKMLRN